MDRITATKLCRDELDKHGLSNWHVRLTNDPDKHFLGLCSYKDECIILNAFHIDIHPEPEIVNTILHEIAHALCPNQGHNDVWRVKATELGCTSVGACSHLSLSPDIIDAIRSGADVKVEFETETIVQTFHKPKYTVTRLQDKCKTCGKVAKTVSEKLIQREGQFKTDLKFITLECGHIELKEIPKGTPFHTLVSNWWQTDVASCEHQWVKNQCSKCAQYKPFPFQVDGARFLEQALASGNGGGIFDEMGLGKTIQALMDLFFHPEHRLPALWFVKSGIKFQISKEIIRWMGPAACAQVIERGSDIVIPGLKNYIISYDLLVPKVRKSKTGKTIIQGFSFEKFKGSGIKTIISDECQQLKNPDSSRTQEFRKLIKLLNEENGGVKVIPLSGTPWKNKGSEFFTILNIIAPHKFWSHQHFKDTWVDYYYDGATYKEAGIKNPDKFKDYIKDIVIRREVHEVMSEMPDTNRMAKYFELDTVNQQLYNKEVSEFVKWYNDKILSGEDPWKVGEEGGNILAKLTRMRHLCGLSKIPYTMELIEEFIEESDRRKLVIFVHHKDVGELLYLQLKEKFPNIKILKLTAELSSEDRFYMQEDFNNTPECIMVASTLASGEGINLQSCADAILHERQWNPANEDQAAPGRFRRIGSKFSVVNVTFPTASGTIEDLFWDIVERKRASFHAVMNKGEITTWKQVDLARELVDGIVKEHNKKNSGKKFATVK